MASDKHETHGGDHPTPTPTPAPAKEAKAKTTAPAPDPKAAAALKEAQAASSIGAQIILDYNADSGLGARGGAAATLEENQLIRDTHLVALGLDPVDCSGPPPSPEALKARRAAEEKAASADPQFLPPPSGKATRMTSLAAGIDTADLPPPTEPPTVRGGAAA